MYAIIKDGGKQYKVAEGESLLLDRKDLEPGTEIEFDQVLMYSHEDDIRVGAPTLDNVKVTAEVGRQEKGDKLVVVKFRRRKGSKTKAGHRQKYTRVTIRQIAAS